MNPGQHRASIQVLPAQGGPLRRVLGQPSPARAFLQEVLHPEGGGEGREPAQLVRCQQEEQQSCLDKKHPRVSKLACRIWEGVQGCDDIPG